MFRREMGSKRGSLPPKEGDLTCMLFVGFSGISFLTALKRFSLALAAKTGMVSVESTKMMSSAFYLSIYPNTEHIS